MKKERKIFVSKFQFDLNAVKKYEDCAHVHLSISDEIIDMQHKDLSIA